MNIETKEDFRAALQTLGLSQGGLARMMVRLGDNRPVDNVRRSIERMLAGDSRVSGEMRAMLGLAEMVPEKLAELAASREQKGKR